MENKVELKAETFKDSHGSHDSHDVGYPLRDLERYNFSNDVDCDKYREITDIYKKTFLDVAVRCPDSPYGFGEAYSKKMGEKFKKEDIIDPDSYSPLLQKIYKILWSDVFEQIDMDIMRNAEGNICGDTMNSIWTTLNKAYDKAKIETEAQRKERGRNNISERYLLHRYVKDRYSEDEIPNLDIEAELKENGGEFVSSLDKIRGLRVFLESAHTLGNFIPVPNGFNTEKNSRLKDYWDLTLKVIYDYYMYDSVEEIAGKEKKENYQNWLDPFKDWLDTFKKSEEAELETGRQRNWDNFVRKNYMRAFVNIKEYGKEKYDENEHYGVPKELWDGHFDKKGLPKEIKQAEQYFERASFCIHERSVDMVDELEKVLKEKEVGNDICTVK